MVLANFLIGVCLMGLGIFMMIKAYYLNHQIYFLEFAERRFGAGGGTLAYRYIGLGLVIFSVFVIIGRINLVNQSASRNTNTQTPTYQFNPDQAFNIAP
jgi:hypothetical protein